MAAAFVVMDVTAGLGDHGSAPGINAAGSPLASPTSSGAAPEPGPETTAEAAKLSRQLAAARADLIPSSFTIGHDPGTIFGATPALEFEYLPISGGYYGASALLSDGQGDGDLMFDVDDHHSTAYSTCPPADAWVDCAKQTLPDGTRVMTYSHTEGTKHVVDRNFMTALRPDGTAIMVDSGVSMHEPRHRPAPPLSTAQLLRFASVFHL